ncbi:hypothetical protein ACIP9C_03120 [Lysinibacillus sp. NPDC093210]|uniref:hypothetical protein n=1 Tax=Lysinibacillus sp. NPDC093210 TaxID=3364133 RepID=UPI00382AF715
MGNKQEERSEETKKQIVESSGKLISKQGYDFVTIRAIAWMLGVPLQPFTFAGIASENKWKQISLEYIHFCLQN